MSNEFYERYLQQLQQRRKGERIEVLEVDKNDRFLMLKLSQRSLFGQGEDYNIEEVFLSLYGNRVDQRTISYNQACMPYPSHSVFGWINDIGYDISQGQASPPQDWDEDQTRAPFSFQLKTGLADDYQVYLTAEYKAHFASGDLVAVNFFRTDEKERPYKEWDGFKGGARFLRRGNQWVKDAYRDPIYHEVVPLDGLFVQKTAALHKLTSTQGINQLTSNLVDQSRELVFTFPDHIDIAEWDARISVRDRSWRDLAKQMPISLQINRFNSLRL